MSYSFSVQATTKAEAKAAAETKFDEVVVQQPIHARDKAAALANVSAVVDLLTDKVPEGHIISVGVSGYVSWLNALSSASDNPLTTVSISANASYTKPVV